MLNRAMIIGNVGKDPDIRTTTTGNKVASFSVATSDRWTDKNTGEKKEKTEWHRVTVFNENVVGIVEKYVAKGSKVYIEGKLRTRKWTDKDGVERYTTEIVLENFAGQIELLDKRQGGPPPADDGSFGETPQNRSDRKPATSAAGKNSDMDDEIPF